MIIQKNKALKKHPIPIKALSALVILLLSVPHFLPQSLPHKIIFTPQTSNDT